MDTNDDKGTEIGLSFSRRMPLSWQRMELPEVSLETEAADRRNERLLQLLLLYDEHPNERRDEDGEGSGELERLETKLDAVLHLLAELIAEQGSPADERLVEVSARHLEWIEERSTAPAEAERLWVLAELDPRLPRPLKMAARVEQLTLVEPGEVRVRVETEALGERAQQALEKLIFRIHRREIARMRSRKQP